MLSVLHNDVKVAIMAALSFHILLFLQELTQISLISYKIIFEVCEEPIFITLIHPCSQHRFLGVCRYCCKWTTAFCTLSRMMHLSASFQLVRGQHSDDSSCVGGVITTSKDRTALALRGFG